MNLSAVSNLSQTRLNGTWYRSIATGYYPTALASAHTTKAPSRFGAGPFSPSPFEVLYLAETSLVAEFEVGAVFGTLPSHISHPRMSFTLVAAQVQLSRVVNLSDPIEQAKIEVDAQLLTGDWRAYQTRTPISSVSLPVGLAPTQEIGAAVFNDSRLIEGIITVSAKVATHQTLVVFPQNMSIGNYIQYTYNDGRSPPKIFRINGTR